MKANLADFIRTTRPKCSDRAQSGTASASNENKRETGLPSYFVESARHFLRSGLSATRSDCRASWEEEARLEIIASSSGVYLEKTCE